MPLIVLEGVDGAGKTTYAEQLIAEWPVQDKTWLLHAGQPAAKPIMHQYETALLSLYDPRDPDQLVVCDRWHVGETVYGPIYRGRSRLTPGMARYVDQLLDSLGAVKCVLSGTLKTLTRRLADRGEDFLKPEHLALVADQYHTYAYDNGWMSFLTPPPVDDTLAMARQSWLKAQSMLSLRGVKYYGGPGPSRLFITTVQNPYLSFSHFETLAAQRDRRTGFIIVNDTYNLKTALMILKEPKLVALTAEAENMCRLLGRDFLGRAQ